MIHEMVKLTNKIDKKIPITFPVRAYYLPSLYSELEILIQNPNRTFTIWNNEPVQEDLQQWMRDNLDPKKTFYDLIDSHGNPMKL